MTKTIFQMRTMVKTVAILAAVTMFAACEPEEENNPTPDETEVNGVDIPDADYYGNEESDLRIALRNVRLKWIVKDGDVDNATGELSPDEYGEAMVCKGRQWSKGHSNDYRDDPVLCEQWYAYDADGIFRGYNFIEHEMYAVDYYTTPPAPFGISSPGAGAYVDLWKVLAQYYEDDSKQNYWNEPYTTWYDSEHKKSTTTAIKEDKAATVAGRLCNMYTVVETLYVHSSNGTTSSDITLRKVWYDPETGVTMRVEEYDRTYGLNYTTEITEIEYGKVTVAQVDKILENYLNSNTPTDISEDEDPGIGW